MRLSPQKVGCKTFLVSSMYISLGKLKYVWHFFCFNIYANENKQKKQKIKRSICVVNCLSILQSLKEEEELLTVNECGKWM